MPDLSDGRNTVGPQALIHPYQAFIVPMEVAHEDRILSEELPDGFWDDFMGLATDVYDLADPSSQGFAFTDENLSVYKLPSRTVGAERPNMGLVFECLACLDDKGEEIAEYSAHTHRPTSFAPVGRDVGDGDISEMIDQDVEYVLGGETPVVEPDRYELHLSLALVYEQFPRHYLPISVSGGVEASTRDGETDPRPALPEWTLADQTARIDDRLPGERSVAELSTTVTVGETELTELTRHSPVATLQPSEIAREYAFSRPS